MGDADNLMVRHRRPISNIRNYSEANRQNISSGREQITKCHIYESQMTKVIK